MNSRSSACLKWILAVLFLLPSPLHAEEPEVPKHLLAVKTWKGTITISQRDSGSYKSDDVKSQYKTSCRSHMKVELPLVGYDSGEGNDPFDWGTDHEAEKPKNVGTGTSEVSNKETGSSKAFGSWSRTQTGGTVEVMDATILFYPFGYQISMGVKTNVKEVGVSKYGRETRETTVRCTAGAHAQPYPEKGYTLSGSYSYREPGAEDPIVQQAIAQAGAKSNQRNTISWRLYPADKPDPGPEPAPAPEPEEEPEPEPEPEVEEPRESCEDIQKRPDAEKNEMIDHIASWAETVMKNAKGLEKHFEQYVKEQEEVLEVMRQQLSALESIAEKEDEENIKNQLEEARTLVANAEKDLLKLQDKLETIRKVRQECENDAATAKEYKVQKSQDLNQAACDAADLSRRIKKHETQLKGAEGL